MCAHSTHHCSIGHSLLSNRFNKFRIHGCKPRAAKRRENIIICENIVANLAAYHFHSEYSHQICDSKWSASCLVFHNYPWQYCGGKWNIDCSKCNERWRDFTIELWMTSHPFRVCVSWCEWCNWRCRNENGNRSDGDMGPEKRTASENDTFLSTTTKNNDRRANEEPERREGKRKPRYGGTVRCVDCISKWSQLKLQLIVLILV